MNVPEQAMKLAKQEVLDAYARLNALVSRMDHPSGSYQLKYDDVNDIGDIIKNAAWRIRPDDGH